jgi:hypothetical protein
MNRWLFLAGVLALLGGSFAAFSHFVLNGPAPFRFELRGETVELGAPMFLGLLVAWPLLLYGTRHSLADLPWQQRWATLLLRIGFLAALAVALARPVTNVETQKTCTVFVLDVSESITDEALEQARGTLQAALRELPPDNCSRLITFASRPRLESLSPQSPNSGGEGDALRIPELPALRHDKAESQGSNLQAALELAYGVFPPGTLKRAWIFSDGLETEGDVLSQVQRARRFGVVLHTSPFTLPPPAEVALQSLTLPDKVAIGEPFKIRAEIYASRKSRARARLYQGEVLNGLDGVRELALEPGVNEIAFQSVVRFGGEVSYKLQLDEIEQDRFEANNGLQAKLQVPGRPAVLYVEGQPQRASYLTSALAAQQFDVDVRPASAFPASLAELERYEFLILSDVPAEQVNVTSQDLIERYVRDLGGGFLFAGGERGFGLGGWGNTSVERILPVRMDAERQREMPTVALALVIDRSGSMAGLPLEMAKAACSATVSTLKGDDLVEVIAFDASPNRYVKLQPARYSSRIQNDILQIQSGGGTAIFPALYAAYQDLTVVQAR